VLLNRLSPSQHGLRSIAITVHNRKQSVPKRVSAGSSSDYKALGGMSPMLWRFGAHWPLLIAALASIIAAPVGVDLRRSTCRTETRQLEIHYCSISNGQKPHANHLQI